MNCRYFNSQASFLLILISIVTVFPENTSQLTRCKQDLMKCYYLQGMRTSIVEKMHVCPHVHDKCCTLADEVKITHLWNKHTGPIVERYTEDVIANINATMRNFFKMMKMDPNLMTLKYAVSKQVPFKYKHCYAVSRIEQTYRDKEILKEYVHGSMRFINKRIWKYNTTRKKIKTRPPLGGFYEGTPKAYKTDIKCNTRVDSFYREFIVVNPQKTEYCIGIHDRFMDFRVKDFIQLLPNVKNSLTFIAGLKRKFYCDLCDAHSHQFFDLKQKAFVISQKFCNNLLRKKMDYFKFMHIVWVEFANQLLNYQGCFETDGKVFDFPFQNFLGKYLKRIPLIKKCLSSLDDKKNFYKNCWMMCQLYRYDSFSAFFDGDVEMLRRVNVSLFSFLRKVDRAEVIQEKLTKKTLDKFSLSKAEKTQQLIDEIMLPESVDKTLIEPFNPTHMMTDGKFYLDKMGRLRTFGLDNTDMRYVGYRSDEERKFHKLEFERKNKLAKVKFTKLQNKVRDDKLRKKGKWIPPIKKKLKFPFKKPILLPSGNIDRLSTLRFSEHMNGMSPQRSLFLTRSSDIDASQIAKNLNISDDEKDELVKSYGYVGPKDRELLLSVDDGINQMGQNQMPQVTRQLRRIINRKNVKRRRKTSLKRRRKSRERERDGTSDASLDGSEDYERLQKIGEKVKSDREENRKDTIQEDSDFEEKVKDTTSTKLKTTKFVDFYSKKNKEFPKRKIYKKKQKFPEAYKVEELNQIFEKVESKVDTSKFAYAFEKDGLNPLHNVELLNFRYNITRLIEMRFKLPEKISYTTVKEYMGVDAKTLKDFNKDLEWDVSVYEDVNEIMSEVNRLNQFRKKIMKGDQDPMLLAKITKEMNRLKKMAKENAARKEVVKKEMRRRRNRKGHTDLNHNKYPDFHHHHDLYFNDTFHGIEEMFSHIFGS